MRTKGAGGMLATGALVLLLGAPAAAQLAKQGTYSAVYGWTLSSTVHKVEDGHDFTHDVYKGTIFNDAGKGFLHEASNVCFGVSDLIQGKGDAHGYCVVTDKNNDKAFLVWKGTIDPDGFPRHLPMDRGDRAVYRPEGQQYLPGYPHRFVLGGACPSERGMAVALTPPSPERSTGESVRGMRTQSAREITPGCP